MAYEQPEAAARFIDLITSGQARENTMRNLLIIGIVLIFGSAASAQDAKERLEKSRRHHEWVTVKNGDRKVACFLVFPEVKDKATAVVVIHENKGLTDWVRGVADQLAEAGYIAIAPDMLSGAGPKGGNTDAFPSSGEATKAIGQLPADQVTGRLERRRPLRPDVHTPRRGVLIEVADRTIQVGRVESRAVQHAHGR